MEEEGDAGELARGCVGMRPRVAWKLRRRGGTRVARGCSWRGRAWGCAAEGARGAAREERMRPGAMPASTCSWGVILLLVLLPEQDVSVS